MIDQSSEYRAGVRFTGPDCTGFCYGYGASEAEAREDLRKRMMGRGYRPVGLGMMEKVDDGTTDE